jgi:hypothetical protein
MQKRGDITALVGREMSSSNSKLGRLALHLQGGLGRGTGLCSEVGSPFFDYHTVNIDAEFAVG